MSEYLPFDARGNYVADTGVKRVPEDRLKAVKCMEFLARQVNDEEIFDLWLSAGVADGDIYYGDLTGGEIDDYYLDDKHFQELIHIFLLLMSEARRSGGLYIDGVVSE